MRGHASHVIDPRTGMVVSPGSTPMVGVPPVQSEHHSSFRSPVAAASSMRLPPTVHEAQHQIVMVPQGMTHASARHLLFARAKVLCVVLGFMSAITLVSFWAVWYWPIVNVLVTGYLSIVSFRLILQHRGVSSSGVSILWLPGFEILPLLYLVAGLLSVGQIAAGVARAITTDDGVYTAFGAVAAVTGFILLGVLWLLHVTLKFIALSMAAPTSMMNLGHQPSQPEHIQQHVVFTPQPISSSHQQPHYHVGHEEQQLRRIIPALRHDPYDVPEGPLRSPHRQSPSASSGPTPFVIPPEAMAEMRQSIRSPQRRFAGVSTPPTSRSPIPRAPGGSIYAER